RIYFVSFGTNNLPNGSLGYIDSSMNIIILSSYIGYLDGISLEKKTGSIIFTDWIAFEKKGKLLKYKISTKKLSTISTTEIGGPADFIYDIKSNKYYIPAMLENAIITINNK
ncbi:hypothetical protein K2X92_02690, partial [Candidatus Gracilibacteria bacterium]|nr:hypothetical protein [Candidatus Gracilibacteria bacterium]